MSLTVWTIGHSTRSFDEFLAVLGAHRIEAIADVRRFPGSRRLPQYNSEALEQSLGAHDLAYHWIAKLGGRRKPDPNSVNDGWRVAAFRGYADHVASEEFADGLFSVLVMAGGLRTAVMCAEVLWWRCHRRLIADVLVSLGIQVVHISDARASEHHRIAPPARLVGGFLSYQSDAGGAA